MAFRFLIYSEGTLDDILATPLSTYGDLVESDGSQKPTDYDLLVFDGRTVAPEALAKQGPKLQAQLEADRPFLIYRPTPAHKAGLAEAGVIHHYIEEGSFALYVEPQRDASGALRIGLAEHFGVAAEGKVERTLATLRRDATVASEKTEEFDIETEETPDVLELAPFIERIRHSVHRLSAGQSIEADTAATGLPPKDVPKELWDRTPINVYQAIHPQGAKADGYRPPQGKLTLEALVSLGIFYDDRTYNEPIQWLHLKHEGHLTAHMVADTRDHRGWSNASLNVQGEDISSASLIANQSSPNNVNRQRQYTSRSSFTVGVKADPKGLWPSLSYSIGSSETATIRDWKIAQSTPNSWLFDQQVPYDGDARGFPHGAAGEHGVSELPEISKGTLAFDTQTVWVHLPADRKEKSVNYSYQVTSRFTWSERTGKDWKAWNWSYWAVPSRTFKVRFGKAWPVKK